MEELFLVTVLSRWVHVATAIILVGGSAFFRFIVMPAAATLPDSAHVALREQLLARWRRIVGPGIGLFLISGFYNFIVVAVPQHRGDGLYHGLMGTKILLAFVVFFLISALMGRSPAFEAIRNNSRKWMAITLILSMLIVGISGFLKIRGAAKVPPTPTQVADAM